MFDINFSFDNMNISSMESADIISAMEWLVSEKRKGNLDERYLNIRELRERFLESYLSEGEFFLKIIKGQDFVGMLKGRIEFKSSNEVWIWYYIINKDLKSKGIDSIILENLTSYFDKEFGIYSFFTVVSEDNIETKAFWNRNGFNLVRIAENFFENDGGDINMLIFKKG
jgi:ribosomal protein S18 acetylase RimI-like enzyme